MTALAPLTTGLRALCFVFWFGHAAQAQSCRLALVLALDVSGSVDSGEYVQQINGLAHALDTPDVRARLLDGAGAPVSLTVYEWSSRNHQIIIQPWVVLDSPAVLDAAILRIRSHKKVRAGLKTALGTALTFGATLLQQKTHCWSQTIDVSGDGENNIGPNPSQVYALDAFDQITVNALVVDSTSGPLVDEKLDLLSYYKTEVIHGPSSFAMIARGYADYADAMRRKLLRELELPVFGANID